MDDVKPPLQIKAVRRCPLPLDVDSHKLRFEIELAKPLSQSGAADIHDDGDDDDNDNGNNNGNGNDNGKTNGNSNGNNTNCNTNATTNTNTNSNTNSNSNGSSHDSHDLSCHFNVHVMTSENSFGVLLCNGKVECQWKEGGDHVWFEIEEQTLSSWAVVRNTKEALPAYQLSVALKWAEDSSSPLDDVFRCTFRPAYYWIHAGTNHPVQQYKREYIQWFVNQTHLQQVEHGSLVFDDDRVVLTIQNIKSSKQSQSQLQSQQQLQKSPVLFRATQTWSSGLHFFTVYCASSSRSSADNSKCSGIGIIGKETKRMYLYFENGGVGTIADKKIEKCFPQSLMPWKAKDEVVVLLNCDSAKVRFYCNNQFQCECDIQPNVSYFPLVFVASDYDYTFHLN
ncbi:minor serine proteinase [Reticulomyxa filosa]|uniref:Minor serine proteinase n=1 Tax=Reticulomyxa filosa TaxID=46433 RepID=X6LTJ5_RETFI|nr:minor serine proteinase [Reticulomyxa filosa]|eukprot:ETO04412.1 minor serine proteinase [Reticulomyxa filosa]